MKRILLLSILFVVCCNEKTNVEPTVNIDCMGNEGSHYILDDCGDCIVHYSEEFNSKMDCNNECNGNALIDCSSSECTSTPANVEIWDICYNIAGTDTFIRKEEEELNNGTWINKFHPNITKLTNLVYLDISGNYLDDSIPATLGNLTSLTHLDLSGNGFYSSFPTEIGNLTNLAYFAIGEGVDFNASDYTEEFGNLTSLTEFYAGGGMKGESIPSWFWNLTNLTVVDLGGNGFTGEIPPEIGTLTNLTQMDLPLNDFTGKIPIEICNLNDVNFRFRLNRICPPSGIPYNTSYSDLSICGANHNIGLAGIADQRGDGSHCD